MKQEPYIVTYRSKPIKGIVLELWSVNPNYKTEKEILEENIRKFGDAMRKTGWGITEER